MILSAPVLKTEFSMNTYVAIIGGKAVLAFRAEDDDQARAVIDDQHGSMRFDLKVLVDTDGNRYGMGSPPLRRERRRRHSMSHGSSLATKQFAMAKLTWTLATIQPSGLSI